MREGGREGGWRWHYKEMLIPTKGNQSPNDSTGRKGEREGNEMENSNKLEIKHRGRGRGCGGCPAGRQLPKGLEMT